MSLLINLLLLTTLICLPVCSTQSEGFSGEYCPQVEVLRGRDGRDGRDGGKGEKGDMPPPGQKGEQGEIGPPGPQGSKGMRGEKGIHGDAGVAGLQGEQGIQGPATGGTTYIRWGRTTCPSGHGTSLVYSGRAGGTRYDNNGGAANYLCMPNDPDYLSHNSGLQGHSHVAGVEYYYSSFPNLQSLNYHNVPCSVCYVVNRSVALMIPAKTQCPTDWTLEYIGYLMSEEWNYSGRSMYECVDKDPESVPGLNRHSNPRAFFYQVESYCNGLSCPPYNAEKELTCAVCTR